MQRINWILLKSKDRGSDYGIGTFIRQLSIELSKIEQVNVFIVEIGISQYQFPSSRNEGNVTIIEVPLPENLSGIDTRKNQERIAMNIARVVTQFIPQYSKNIIHANYLFQYFIGIALKKQLNGILIFTQHLTIPEQQSSTNYFDTEFGIYSKADKIVTVTQHGKNHLVNKGVAADKIEVIYNGIAPEQFDVALNPGIREKFGFVECDKIILFSGRIDPIKGLEYLCLAMEVLIRKFPNCRLVVAGDGDFKMLIERSRKFSANISFLGFISHDDLIDLYHEADIGVIPSLQEQCSYVALEMLHCGLPIVASKLGGLKEIFVHNENALLVDTIEDKKSIYRIAPDIDQLANSMLSLQTNESLKLKFKVNAKKRARSLFTSEIMANTYLQTIDHLIPGNYE